MLKYLRCWTIAATFDLGFILVNVAAGSLVWFGHHQVPWLSLIAIVVLFGLLVHVLRHEYNRRECLSTLREYLDKADLDRALREYRDKVELDREIAEMEKQLGMNERAQDE